MRTNHKDSILTNIVNIAIITVSVLLLIYTGYRAASLSFTIDESISFNTFVPLKFMDIVSYKIPLANNHMINSICIKYISVFFGTSEFLLRLPSLLSHGFYLVFTYLILRKLTSPLNVLSGFLLLNLNPFMLDFFSLARGYAMALSFTVSSVYFFFNYVETNKVKNIIWSLILAMLAMLSSFSWSIYYVSLIVLINIRWITSYNHFDFKDLIRKNRPVFICSILLIVILFEPIRKLTKGHEFYDGGRTSFWHDTVGSLVNATMYGQSYENSFTVFLKYFIAIISLFLIIVFIYNFFNQKGKISSDKFMLAVLLLVLPYLVCIIQHFLLKSLFLINRMALFLIPLFLISVIFLVNEAGSFKLKLISSSLLLVLASVFLIHTVLSLNTSFTVKWRYDSDTRNVLTDLENEVKTDDEPMVKLGAMWLYKPTVNFYRTTRKYKWLEQISTDDYRNSNYDYYYLPDSCMNFIAVNNLSIIKHYTNSNSFLLKRK
jgi:hypothetical protein